MSISFTASQLHIIQLAMTEAEFIQGAEYTSEGREALDALYTEEAPRYPLSRDEWGVKVRDVSPAVVQEWRDQITKRGKRFESDILMIKRWYNRFRKEFEIYQAGGCKLSVVRKAHRDLIDALAPFLR